MASNQVLVELGTPIILADTTDHAPGATAQNNLGARTDQIDLTSLADAGWRESTKFDFGGGTALWALEWAVAAAIEPGAAPTKELTVDFYIGYSQSATAAQGNPANLVGADGIYLGYGAAAADALEASKQLEFIGSLVASADDDIFVASVGVIRPAARYGMLVVNNRFGAALEADAIECSIRLTPIIQDIQAAA